GGGRGDGDEQRPGQDQRLDPAAHLIASLAGRRAGGAPGSTALASGGVSSPPGHRNGAWGCVVPEAHPLALCGVRPGGCGVKPPEADIGRLMADLRAIPWLAATYPAGPKRAPGPITGRIAARYCARKLGFVLDTGGSCAEVDTAQAADHDALRPGRQQPADHHRGDAVRLDAGQRQRTRRGSARATTRGTPRASSVRDLAPAVA